MHSGDEIVEVWCRVDDDLQLHRWRSAVVDRAVESCTVTVVAAQVSDQDGIDPPDT
jgi:hypothetical protein